MFSSMQKSAVSMGVAGLASAKRMVEYASLTTGSIVFMMTGLKAP